MQQKHLHSDAGIWDGRYRYEKNESNKLSKKGQKQLEIEMKRF